jgi:Holliday junction DNA helicase RuvA subunit
MIAKLTGLVDSIGADWVVIDVGGVGYHVVCAGPTLAGLVVGRTVSMAIETQMREDAIRLFGFADAAERDWFRMLQSVQGVGGKVALAILSVLPPAKLVQAIAAQDRAAVSRADGVGPKLARHRAGPGRPRGRDRDRHAGGEFGRDGCGLGAGQSRLWPFGSLRRRRHGRQDAG